MKKVIVLGCPGAGKSTFSRKLAAKTGLPLYYLDMIWHCPDRTIIGRDKFDKKLAEIMAEPEWIIDGNYARTLQVRLLHCDTVFLFDLPLDECINGAKSRLGRERPDMPWVDDKFDPDFLQWILDFPSKVLPEINSILENSDKEIIRFTSRNEADKLIDLLKS